MWVARLYQLNCQGVNARSCSKLQPEVCEWSRSVFGAGNRYAASLATVSSNLFAGIAFMTGCPGKGQISID